MATPRPPATRRAGPSRGPSRGLITLALVALCIAWTGRNFSWITEPKLVSSVDYAAFATAAHMVRGGEHVKIYDWGTDRFDVVNRPAQQAALKDMGLNGDPAAYIYPPWVAKALSVAWPKDYRLGLLLMRWVSLLCLFAGAWLWWSSAAKPANGPPESPQGSEATALTGPMRLCIIMALAWVLEPVAYMGVIGQNGGILVLLIGGSLYAARRDRPWLAGLALALAASVKILPGLFLLVFLFERRRKAVLAFFAWSLAIALASILVMGWPSHVAYFEALQRMAGGSLVAHNNQSFIAVIGRHFTDPSYLSRWEFVQLPFAAKAMAGAANLALVGAFGAVIYKQREKPEAGLWLADAIALVLLLVPAVAWSHYFVWFIPVALGIASRTASSQRVAVWGLLAIATLWLTRLVMENQSYAVDPQAFTFSGPAVAGVLTSVALVLGAWSMTQPAPPTPKT